jgi:transcription elongation factor Elf1
MGLTILSIHIGNVIVYYYAFVNFFCNIERSTNTNPTKTGGELWKGSSSCATSGACRVTLVIKPHSLYSPFVNVMLLSIIMLL